MGGQERRRSHGYGDALADRFWLEETPAHHINRSLARGPLAVTQIRSDRPTPEPSQSIGYDEAFLIGLMVEDVPDHQLWQDGRAVATDPFRAGETAFFDLRRDPINFTRTAHHSLHFYLPRRALQELAERSGMRFDGELRYRFATGYDDPVFRHLGHAALAAMAEGAEAGGLFLDHLLHAVAARALERYAEGGLRVPPANGGLSARNLRMATGMMEAGIAGDPSLGELAAACNLSIPHFCRAFRQSTGVAPHRWLLERRIERARGLLAQHKLSLADIALACGFADQSHFTRTFTRMTGVSPGRWRRLQL